MYLTFYKKKQEHQYNIEDYFFGRLINDTATLQTQTVVKPKNELYSFFYKHKCPEWYNIPQPPETLKNSDIKSHYTSFSIPKKSGGLRRIDAPDDTLKLYLTQLRDYLENVLFIRTHNAAHAYVKTRSTVTAIKVHQENNSMYFLKLDMKNFFPSHTLQYTMDKLTDIYPIGILMEDSSYKSALEKALSYAFLDGYLPQGTPLSPTLTNILMTGIDYRIGNGRYIYTRYADDLLISGKEQLNWKSIVEIIKKILIEEHCPFKLNEEKTRYGTKNGKNWNLGIMLNKDNRMTIGHKQNQRFRAMVFNIMKDYKNGIYWSAEDKQVLAGNIAYYKSIDKIYTEQVVARYEMKFGLNLKEILK